MEEKAKTQGIEQNQNVEKIVLSQPLEFVKLREARGHLGVRTWGWKNAVRDRQANTGELETCLCACVHTWGQWNS